MSSFYDILGKLANGKLFSAIIFAPDGETQARDIAATRHGVIQIDRVFNCTVAGRPV